MDKEKCGRYIREKREALGLTREDLAEKLNVSAYDVDCWEAGFFPSAEFLLPLSDALQIDVEELLSGEDLAEKTSAAPVSPSSVSEPSFHAPSEVKRSWGSKTVSAVSSDSERSSASEAISAASPDSERPSVSETTSAASPDSECPSASEAISDASPDSECPSAPELSAPPVSPSPPLSEVPSVFSPPVSPSSAPPAEKSYYEELREKMNDTDWENVEVPQSGENGFSRGERRFGKILCICFIVVVLIIQLTRLFGYLNRDRELTLENYREYIEISVYATDGAASGGAFVSNPDEYAVRITAKEDIGEFSVAIEVTFSNILYGEIVRTVNIGGESLSEGNTAEETLSFDTVVMKTVHKVISVEGKLP